MTQANDSITVTPGSGATVATHLAASKEHQVVMLANEAGVLHGTAATYAISTGNTAHVAAARTTIADLFNATGSGMVLRVVGVHIQPTLTAVTGVGQTYELIRTSGVGTGGSSANVAAFDSAFPSLPAEVTARVKPTGGATTAATLLYVNGTSEETIAYASLASQLNHVPSPKDTAAATAIVLREGEGLKVDQTTNSAVGSINVVFVVVAQ
jgi:hypothetical protein